MSVLTERGGTPKVIAHRGNSSVAPENTLVAIESAIRCGAHAIEIDVQLTRDGVPVIIHDTALDRTTDGSGPLADVDSAHLRTLDAGSWFAPVYAHQRVPLLEEVLARLAQDSRIELLLEFKGTWEAADVRAVADAIAGHRFEDRVVVQSFSVPTVAALAEVAPALRRGLLIAEPGDTLLDQCRGLGVVTGNPSGRVVAEHPELIAQLHEAGLAAMVFTLNEPAHWTQAAALGVDAVFTDRPDRMLGWLGDPPGAG